MQESEYVDIDLSLLREMMGKMIPGSNYELYIIKHYRKLADKYHNTIKLVDNDIIAKLKGNDASKLALTKYYYSYMAKFIANLEILILHSVPPDVVDIIYEKVMDLEKLIVRFKVITRSI